MEPDAQDEQEAPLLEYETILSVLSPDWKLFVPPAGQPKELRKFFHVSRIENKIMRVINRSVLDAISPPYEDILIDYECNMNTHAYEALTRVLQYIGMNWNAKRAFINGPMSEVLHRIVARNGIFFNNLTTVEINCDRSSVSCPIPFSSILRFQNLLHFSWFMKKNCGSDRAIRVLAPNLKAASIVTEDKDFFVGSVELTPSDSLQTLELTLNAMTLNQVMSHYFPSVRTLVLKQTIVDERPWYTMFHAYPNLSILSLERFSFSSLWALEANCQFLRVLNISEMNLRSYTDDLPVLLEHLFHITFVCCTIENKFKMVLPQLDTLVVNCVTAKKNPMELTVPQIRCLTHVVTKNSSPLILRRAYVMDKITVKFIGCSKVPALYRESIFPTARKFYIFMSEVQPNLDKVLRCAPNVTTLFLAADKQRIDWNDAITKVVARCYHLEQIVIKQHRQNEMSYESFSKLLSMENIKAIMISNVKISGFPSIVEMPAELRNLRLENVTFSPGHPVIQQHPAHVISFPNSDTICIDRDMPSRQVRKLFNMELDGKVGKE